MAYRKVTVDGVDYKWTVGKTHLKVRGFPAVAVSDVPHRSPAKCACETIFGCDCERDYDGIRPADVIRLIRERLLPTAADTNNKRKA